jgi:hypothetical protein
MPKVNIEIEFKKEAKPDVKSVESIDPNVEFSTKLVDYLKTIAKEHNSNYAKKVNLFQLKQVFSHAAGIYKENKDYSKVEYSIARIGLFLRMLSGNYLFESVSAQNVMNSDVDVSDTWTPSKSDFSLAKESVEKFGLNFSFDNVEDLYLEDNKISRYVDLI